MRKKILHSLTLLGMLSLYGCSAAQLASISEAFDCADPLSIDCSVSRQRANEERRKADEYRREQERYEREYAEYLDCLNRREEAKVWEAEAEEAEHDYERWRLEQKYLEDGVLDELEQAALKEEIRVLTELREFQAKRSKVWQEKYLEDTSCYKPYRPIEPYYSY